MKFYVNPQILGNLKHLQEWIFMPFGSGGHNILYPRLDSCQFRYENVSLIVNNSTVMKWRVAETRIKVIRSEKNGGTPPKWVPHECRENDFGVTLLNFAKAAQAGRF